MGTSPESGMGKSPEQIEAEAPTDEQLLQHLEQQAADIEDTDPAEDVPSRDQLWQVIQAQQDRILDLEQRLDQLEADVDDVQYEADTMDEVAKQFRKGEIGGEAGASFIREFVSVPASDSKVNARSLQLFFRIIEERRVGKPVRSKDVVNWLGLQDSANPSIQAKRIMDRVERHREDGYLIGNVEIGKYRGQNCIWLKRE